MNSSAVLRNIGVPTDLGVGGEGGGGDLLAQNIYAQCEIVEIGLQAYSNCKETESFTIPTPEIPK